MRIICFVAIAIAGCGGDGGGGARDTGGGGDDGGPGSDAGDVDAGGGDVDAGGGDVDGGPAMCTFDVAARDAYCVDYCAMYDARCAPDGPPCMTECQENMLLFRTETWSMLADCFAALDCMEAGDTCFGNVAMALGSRPGDDAYRAACLTKREMCMGSFVDDYCFGTQLLLECALDDATVCLDGPCDAVPACINAAFGDPG